MTGRIKGPDSQAIGTGTNRPVERVRRTSGAGAPLNTADQTTERQINALWQAIGNTPDVDTRRVAALQQSIDQGQYQIYSRRIADRVLQLEGDLSALIMSRLIGAGR